MSHSFIAQSSAEDHSPFTVSTELESFDTGHLQQAITFS